MTNDPARALLRRVVEWHARSVLGGPLNDHPRDTMEAIANDARALLAQPAPECAGPFVDAKECPAHRKDVAAGVVKAVLHETREQLESHITRAEAEGGPT